MMPLLKNQAQQGNRVPSRLPNLELSDIDPDPDKAKEILDAYQKNLPKYLENGKDTLFTKEDEWEVPPVSTELRIFGSKKDNTTPQVVDAIKKVAGVEEPLEERNARRSAIEYELNQANVPYMARGVPFVQEDREIDIMSIYEGSEYYDKNKERPAGYKINELTGEREYQWVEGGKANEKPKDIENIKPPKIYQPKEGDMISGGQGRHWRSTSGKTPKGLEPYVVLKRDGKSTLLTMEEFKEVKPYIDKLYTIEEGTGMLRKK